MTGVSVSETTAETKMVTLSVTANSRNNRPTISPIKSSGIKTAIREIGQRQNRKADLLGTLERGLQGRVAVLDVAHDVFDHDDGVVDDEAGGDGERHERQVVQAVTEQIHDAESADDGQRHGDAGNHRGRKRAKKEKNYHHDQSDGEHQLELHVLDGSADGVGAVGQYGNIHRGGQRALELGQERLYAVDHGDDVGAGLALNVDDDRRRLIGPGSELVVLYTVDHCRDIGEPHRRAVTVGDDRRSVLTARQQLIVGADGISLMSAVEITFGLIDVRLGDAAAQSFQRETIG